MNMDLMMSHLIRLDATSNTMRESPHLNVTVSHNRTLNISNTSFLNIVNIILQLVCQDHCEGVGVAGYLLFHQDILLLLAAVKWNYEIQ